MSFLIFCGFFSKIAVAQSYVSDSINNDTSIIDSFEAKFVYNGEDLIYFGLSTTIVVFSIIVLVVAGLRQRHFNLTQLSFGCMSLTIGLRFLFDTLAFQFMAGGNPEFWDVIQSVLMYLITMFAFAFIRSYVGPGWRSSLRWVAWSYFIFGCIAIYFVLVYPEWQLLNILNNLVIALLLITILVNVLQSALRKKTGQRILAVCCIGGIQYFILEVLRNLNLISLDLTVQWSRGLIFYSILAILSVAIYYFFSKEKKLATIRQEMIMAKRIQTSILPKVLPAIPGLDVASRYLPMTEVAGDFYDFFSDSKSCLGILVADVSGHGVSAALIASMIKVAFLAQANKAHSPKDVLTGLNEIFSSQLENQYITAGYVYIDLAEGRLYYAGAAHPPLLILPGNGDNIISLVENGLMLGPFPDAVYENASYCLTPGDRIVMYTDGITEASNKKGEQFGEKRFRRILAKSKALDANEFADMLLATTTTWTNAKQEDDLTIVVLDYQAENR